MVKITLENGTVLEGSVEELHQMGVKLPQQVKPLEVGDYAKVVGGGNFSVGDIVKILSDDGTKCSPLLCGLVKMGGDTIGDCDGHLRRFKDYADLIPATDEEVAEAKKQAQPETITHEGVEYRRVDREAREGDVVVFTETTSGFVANKTPYVVGSGLRVTSGWPVYNDRADRTPANVKVYEPIVAKPAPLQVGDYARVVEEGSHSASYGDLVKVIEDDKDDQPYFCENIKGKGVGYFYPKELTRATDEEVAEAKRQQAEKAVADKWADIGRKPNEFKVGDAVQYKKAFTTVTYVGAGYVRINQPSNVERNIAVNPADLTLVFPVESKFGGDSE